MVFNKHGSFYVRKSWPMKGLWAVKKDPTIFTPQNELLAVDTLGIGRVMVTSLRYWMGAMKLTKERRDTSGRIVLEKKKLADTILKYDPLFQDIGTAWLLHRNLAQNEEEATTWYWFFNEFDREVFTQEEFLDDLKAYTMFRGKTIADSSFKRDFDCLRKTYEKGEFKNISDYIEEGIISYFSQLNLIEKLDKTKYKKLSPSYKELPDEILLYSILDDVKDNTDQISIKDLHEGKRIYRKSI